ncbi:hypothetical protein KP509_25G073200 [Ceratopteris richardii]|uniref:Metallothionein-like protein n=1 Tax=Ceratopteris richardii TaxID=49495 RepID=A0A8T2RSF5_CERRI|nr:hypothetical protein KP509_25G073200 [Ceratopteris richardii]
MSSCGGCNCGSSCGCGSGCKCGKKIIDESFLDAPREVAVDGSACACGSNCSAARTPVLVVLRAVVQTHASAVPTASATLAVVEVVLGSPFQRDNKQMYYLNF